MTKKVGAAIKRIRKTKGISQRKLEELIDAAPGHVSRWEHGDFLPSAYYLTRMADVLECTTDELLGRG